METQAKTKDFRVKVSTQVDEGERTITAVVSSGNLDRDYERVDVPSLRLPLKGGGHVMAGDLKGNEPLDIPMLLNHSFDVEDVIGSVRKGYLNESNELVVVFGISKRAKAQDLMLLIDEQHLDNAFSITMNDYEYSDSTFYSAEVVEISLVFRGSNKDARVLAVKSLLKGESMAEAKETLEAKKAALAQITKEIEELETPVVKPVETVVVDDQAKIDAEAKAKEEAEAEAQAAADAKAEADKKEAEELKDKETKMSKENDIAVKQVVPAAEQPEQVAKTVKKMSAREKKILTVKQIKAMLDKDHAEVARLNKIAMENDEAGAESKAFKSKAITYAEGTAVSLYLAEQLDRDVDRQLTDVGNVGSLVRRIRLTESPKYRRIVRTDGVRFMKPGFAGVKGEDEPTWVSFTLYPKPYAVIIGWNDHVAEDAYINMYDELVQDIAEAEAYLEDETILIEDGATATDGTVYPVQGLVPLLTTAGRVRAISGYDSTDVIGALGFSYGTLKGRGLISLVANTTTWGMLATSIDGFGRPLFNVVGQQVSAGALGSFNVTVSDVLEDGQVVIGRYQNYTLAEKEGLELFESRHATVGGINAFTEDYTFLRAVKRLEGGVPASRLNTFYLLEFSAS